MNRALQQSEPLPWNATPYEKDVSPIGLDFSFLDEAESPTKSCSPMDAHVANPMDSTALYSCKGLYQDNDDKALLQQQLYEMQNQLEATTKARNEEVQLNHHLVQELEQTRSNLHQERVMYQTYVQHALQHDRAVNERAVQSFLSCVLPQHVTMFPQSIVIGPDGNIKNYMLEETVGKGAYGRVVRATHFRTRKKVAVKLVSVTCQGLKQEVKALMYCNHPNVVRMHEYIVDQGQETFGMILELGQMDVNTYFESGNVLTPSALRQVMLATLKAIQYLHSQGICHMDVKSDNLLIMNKPTAPLRQEHIKLCDFGLVSIAAPGQIVVTETMLKGTPPFFAPEMSNCMPYSANVADIWSIGCTLLDLTDEVVEDWRDTYNQFVDMDDTDRYVFQTGIRHIVRVMNEQHYFDHKPAFAPAFDLMRLLLKFNPDRRPTATQALQHEWLQE